MAVVGPALLGMLARGVVVGSRFAAVRPWLKLVNMADLRLLSYVNAAVALPEAMEHPDPTLLATTLGLAAGLIAATFGAGWLTA